MGESDTNKIQSNTHWRDCTGTLKSLSVNAVLARGMVSIRNVVIQRFVLACWRWWGIKLQDPEKKRPKKELQNSVKHKLLVREILVAALFAIPGRKCLFSLSNYTLHSLILLLVPLEGFAKKNLQKPLTFHPSFMPPQIKQVGLHWRSHFPWVTPDQKTTLCLSEVLHSGNYTCNWVKPVKDHT